ncbi:hypothetical protein [Rheinheimera sp. MM224]|uniref:hypothetical protein n=1 Tax=Rheinheimera sp. MM224 TaxID=3019969 RepID=UPI0021F8F780|nr:hypothetical protein [Rheinheimera sp. MM224]CAI3805880.1 hypothetical protein JAMGFMIE_03994 [Rheinheimera sp. MM224]
MKLLLTLTIATLLTGCASTPQYKNYQGADAACIEGDVANFIKFFSSGEAHVGIAEIDGVVADSMGKNCVSPGKHTFGLTANNNQKAVDGYVDLELESGKHYQLQANLVGISFAFKLVDISSKPEQIAHEFKLTANANMPVNYVPVIIQ